MMRIDAQSLATIGQRIVPLAFFKKGAGAIGIGIGIARIEVDDRGIIRNRRIDLMRLVQSVGARAKICDIVRVDAKRCIVVGEGALQVAFGAISDAAHAIGVRSRAKRECLCEIRDRMILVAFAMIENAAVVIGVGVGLIELQSHVVIRKRPRVVALVAPLQAAAAEGRGVGGVDADRVGEFGDGAIVIALFMPGEAAIEIDRCIAGVERARLIVI